MKKKNKKKQNRDSGKNERKNVVTAHEREISHTYKI